MQEKIHLIARFKIHDGQRIAFEKGKDECIALTKNEKGALVYDWYIDDITNSCTVIETYIDSDAVLAHANNVNPALTKLVEIADFSGEVFGNVSEELKGVLKEMGITAIAFAGGL